jgi:hypothetical protein
VINFSARLTLTGIMGDFSSAVSAVLGSISGTEGSEIAGHVDVEVDVDLTQCLKN